MKQAAYKGLLREEENESFGDTVSQFPCPFPFMFLSSLDTEDGRVPAAGSGNAHQKNHRSPHVKSHV